METIKLFLPAILSIIVMIAIIPMGVRKMQATAAGFVFVGLYLLAYNYMGFYSMINLPFVGAAVTSVAVRLLMKRREEREGR